MFWRKKLTSVSNNFWNFSRGKCHYNASVTHHIHEGQTIILTIQFTPCNVTNRQSYQLNVEYMTLSECQFWILNVSEHHIILVVNHAWVETKCQRCQMTDSLKSKCILVVTSLKMQAICHHATSVRLAERQREKYTEDYPKGRAPHVLECNPGVGEYTPTPWCTRN